jgi:hypothetical protein
MPSTSVSSTAVTTASLTHVWERFNDVGTWVGIGLAEEVFDPEYVDGRLAGFAWTTKAAGITYRGSAAFTIWDNPTRLSFDLINTEIRGTISIETAEHTNGTELDVTVGAWSVGLLASMFFPVIAQALQNGLAAQVEDFAVRLASDPAPATD